MADIFDFNGAIEGITQALHHSGPFAGAWVDIGAVGSAIDRFTYAIVNETVAPVEIASSSYLNDADRDASERFSDSKSTTAQAGWTIRQGVTSSLGVTLQQTPLPGSISFGGSSSTTVSFERSDTQSISETQTWTWDTTIIKPARSREEVSVIVDEVTYETTFTARATFYGRVKTRVLIAPSNLIRVRELGIGELFTAYPHPRVQVIDLNNMQVELSGSFRAVRGRKYRVAVQEFKLGAGGKTPKTYQSGILFESALVDLGQFASFDGGTIGPPNDGIHYRVLGSRMEERPAAALCGYNDVSAPNLGEFLVETRLYEEWRDGKLLRSWTEEPSTFQGCVSV